MSSVSSTEAARTRHGEPVDESDAVGAVEQREVDGVDSERVSFDERMCDDSQTEERIGHSEGH